MPIAASYVTINDIENNVPLGDVGKGNRGRRPLFNNYLHKVRGDNEMGQHICGLPNPSVTYVCACHIDRLIVSIDVRRVTPAASPLLHLGDTKQTRSERRARVRFHSRPKQSTVILVAPRQVHGVWCNQGGDIPFGMVR